MKEQNSTVSDDTGDNLLHDIYQEYQASAFIQALNDKYRQRPYYVQYKPMRLLALVASYVFNLFSALTASVLMFFMVEELIGNSIIAFGGTVISLSMLETAKRILASDICQRYFQFNIKISWNWLLLLALFALSIGCSFCGSKKLIGKFSTVYEAPAQPPIISSIERKILALQSQIEVAEKMTYRDGRTTIESREIILLLTSQIGDLEKEKLTFQKDYFDETKTEELVHNTSIESRSFWFALVTLFFEICFVICVWYLEYFDWRSWKEFDVVHKFCTTNKQPENTTIAKAIDILEPTNENSKENIKYLKSRIATAKYRLKNEIGNEETNRRNLEKFEQVLEGMKGV